MYETINKNLGTNGLCVSVCVCGVCVCACVCGVCVCVVGVCACVRAQFPVRAKFWCGAGVGQYSLYIQFVQYKTFTPMGCPHFSQKQT